MMFSHCTILKFLPIIHFNIFFFYFVSLLKADITVCEKCIQTLKLATVSWRQ